MPSTNDCQFNCPPCLGQHCQSLNAGPFVTRCRTMLSSIGADDHNAPSFRVPRVQFHFQLNLVPVRRWTVGPLPKRFGNGWETVLGRLFSVSHVPKVLSIYQLQPNLFRACFSGLHSSDPLIHRQFKQRCHHTVTIIGFHFHPQKRGMY
jgi:hypothetical protein